MGSDHGHFDMSEPATATRRPRAVNNRGAGPVEDPASAATPSAPLDQDKIPHGVDMEMDMEPAGTLDDPIRAGTCTTLGR